jgi:hypothetical protein
MGHRQENAYLLEAIKVRSLFVPVSITYRVWLRPLQERHIYRNHYSETLATIEDIIVTQPFLYAMEHRLAELSEELFSHV